MRVFEYSGLEAEDRPDPMAVVFPKVRVWPKKIVMLIKCRICVFIFYTINSDVNKYMDSQHVL